MPKSYIKMKWINFSSKILFCIAIFLLANCTSQSEIANAADSCNPKSGFQPQEAIFKADGIVEFSNGFQSNFFNTENNLWVCENSIKPSINTLSGEDANASFMGASSLFERILNFSTTEHLLKTGEDILKFSNRICSSMGFSYMFQTSGEEQVLGCQITPLSQSAVMLKSSNQGTSVEIGSLSVYAPVIKKALVEHQEKKQASN